MILITKLDKEEYVKLLDEEFAAHGMKRRDGYFRNCYEENVNGERVTLLGFYENKLAGCCHY